MIASIVRVVAFSLGILTVDPVSLAMAQLYEWVDERGIRHFTDDWNSVPEQYRQQVRTLPGVKGSPQTTPPPTSKPEGGTEYTSPVYLWSISYPAAWAIDSRDPSFVRVYRLVDNALCGIHSRAVPFKTVDEFTDFMLAHNERSFKDSGEVFVILARRRISLPNDIIGNDVLTEIGPGGKSRRIYVLADGRGFLVDCETYAENWGKLAPSYDRIINSFRLGKLSRHKKVF